MNFGPAKFCKDCHRPLSPKETHYRCHTCRCADKAKGATKRVCIQCGKTEIRRDFHKKCWRCRAPVRTTPPAYRWMTDDDVRLIRKLRDETLNELARIEQERERLRERAKRIKAEMSSRAIAEKFECSQQTVARIWYGKAYTGVV